MFNQQDIVCEREKLRRFAMKLTRNRPDADDLLQETLLRALEKNESFQTGTNLFRWTSKIMYNLYVTSKRREKFHTMHDPDIYLAKVTYDGSQEEIADLSVIRDALKIITKKHGEILRLVCVENRPYGEVASMLGIPMGTVRSRLSRARGDLDAAIHVITHQAHFRKPARIRSDYHGMAA